MSQENLNKIILNNVVSVEIQFKIISNREMALMYYRKVEVLEDKFDDLSQQFNSYLSSHTIEWVAVSDVAQQHALTSDSIRKRLQNGNFEEGKDFKRNGGRILVHQGAISQLRRQRRSKNG